MAQLGDVKTVDSIMYKGDIENALWVDEHITPKLLHACAWALGGGIAVATKSILKGAIIGGLSSLGSDITDDIMDNYSIELEGYLEKIKNGNAKGIKISKPMRYMYMNGSGTGWFVAGRTELKLVY